MSFKYIINPLTNDYHSIFENEGRQILKQYIKHFKLGSSKAAAAGKAEEIRIADIIREALPADFTVPPPAGSGAEHDIVIHNSQGQVVLAIEVKSQFKAPLGSFSLNAIIP